MNRFFLLWFLILTLNSCSVDRVAYGPCAYRVKTGECRQATVADTDIVASSYTAADSLIRNAIPAIEPHYRFLMTSLSDINNLEKSIPLGRLIGEQLSARFAQRGYTVLEIKLHSGAIVIPRTGEFILSRELRDIGRMHNANVAVAGTYAIGQNQVYLTLKMLDCKSGRIVSSYAYTLPIGPNAQTLLQETGRW